ncbi:molybdopterin-dependent oxidoreductase [Anaplasma phagocytophilum]|uniref:molybdopterin-dependent oxidoreductase n=1 Tax=Anaplasma phagocytophilum TaxID=948 RepID=UPI0020108A76|nr:molybdopterin-dependent oxidoreductase [Anaplasma phagocytophilum]
MLINADLRVDAPIINARVRKQYLERGMRIASIGCNFSYNYQVDHLGDDMALLGEIYNGDHEICKALMAAEHPIIILGQDAIVGDKGHAVLIHVLRIARKFNIVRDGWNGFNVLHKAAARVGGLDVGFLLEDPVYFCVSAILSSAAKNDI